MEPDGLIVIPIVYSSFFPSLLKGSISDFRSIISNMRSAASDAFFESVVGVVEGGKGNNH